MADINNGCESTAFKEAVCVDAGRVYDSCCDRDCLEDLRCYFAPDAQAYVDQAVSVRLKSAEVLNVMINVEPVTFNKGFYSCDLTFFFLMKFDLFLAPNSCPIEVSGISVFTKKVILFGSDGNVKIFSSKQTDEMGVCGGNTRRTTNTPKCVVQCVDPVALSAHLGCVRNCDCLSYIPQSVIDCVGGNVVTDTPNGATTIYATIGLFTIVQLIRNVQMLIPVYDFCIPEKQCDDSTDRPCDVFRRIKFPTGDFFPPKECNLDSEDGYFGCCGNQNG